MESLSECRKCCMEHNCQPEERLRNNVISDTSPKAVTFTSQIRKSSVRPVSRVREVSKTQDVISLWQSHFTESGRPTLIYTSHKMIIIAIIWDLRSFIRCRWYVTCDLIYQLCGFCCLSTGAEGTLSIASVRETPLTVWLYKLLASSAGLLSQLKR